MLKELRDNKTVANSRKKMRTAETRGGKDGVDIVCVSC